MSEMDYQLTDRQGEAWRYLTDDTAHRKVLYGGSKGGGKSFLGCLWAFTWGRTLANKFGLKPSSHPPTLGFMARARSVDFTHTTLETWKRILPPEAYVIRIQQSEIVIDNTFKIGFGGMDNQESINKHNSAEHAFIFLDQAEELEKNDIAVLRGSLRFKHRGIQPAYKQLFTANPKQCWLQLEFIPPMSNDRVFVPALPADNPHLPDNYDETLVDSFGHDERLLRAYRDGDWDAMAGTNILFNMEMIRNCLGATPMRYENAKVISCDPARYGDDTTVIYCWKNEEIIESFFYGKKSNSEVYGYLVDLKQKMGDGTLIVIDEGGGQGIIDRLLENEFDCLPINFGSKALDEERYYNKRAELYGMAQQTMKDRQCAIPNDPKLHTELCAIQYEIRKEQQMQLETKDKIKARISRSPDRADAYVLGLAGLRHIAFLRNEGEWTTKWVDEKPKWAQAQDKFWDERENLDGVPAKGNYT